MALLGNREWFLAKARLTKKIRTLLDELHDALEQELTGLSLLVPEGFSPTNCQFVKGEHLEDCAYQYLDFPKHFAGGETFTFRALVWWGHHIVFAWLIGGHGLLRYKQNLINRYHDVCDRGLCLSLAPTLWEWKQGEGYTLPLTRDQRPQVAAALAERRVFKLARFVPFDAPLVRQGQVVTLGLEAFRSVLPVLTP